MARASASMSASVPMLIRRPSLDAPARRVPHEEARGRAAARTGLSPACPRGGTAKTKFAGEGSTVHPERRSVREYVPAWPRPCPACCGNSPGPRGPRMRPPAQGGRRCSCPSPSSSPGSAARAQRPARAHARQASTPWKACARRRDAGKRQEGEAGLIGEIDVGLVGDHDARELRQETADPLRGKRHAVWRVGGGEKEDLRLGRGHGRCRPSPRMRARAEAGWGGARARDRREHGVQGIGGLEIGDGVSPSTNARKRRERISSEPLPQSTCSGVNAVRWRPRSRSGLASGLG